MQLKMHGPKGNITIHGDLEKAAECDKGGSLFAEKVVDQEELDTFKARVNPKDMTPTKKPTNNQHATFK
jgi:hypothetical protein